MWWYVTLWYPEPLSDNLDMSSAFLFTMFPTMNYFMFTVVPVAWNDVIGEIAFFFPFFVFLIAYPEGVGATC